MRLSNPSSKSRYASDLPNDTVYYNISIVNNNSYKIPATFNQIQTYPIIDNPSDYYLAVIRFSIPGGAIPIITKFDETQYFVTITFGVDSQVQLVYDPVSIFDGDNNVYSYNQLCVMINTALSTAFTNLQGMVSLPPGVTEAPFMKYNNSNYTYALYCQTSYETNNVEIYFNINLYKFFDNFYVTETGQKSITNKDYKFNIVDLHNNMITSDPNNSNISSTNPYYIFDQEYSTLYNINNTQNITFKSCLFHTSSEYSPSSVNQVPSNEKILIDFEPLVSFNDPSAFRGILQYYPQGVYRLITMTCNEPLRNIDLQLSYKTKLNQVYPLFVPKNSSISVKLAFIRKCLYKSTYEH